MTQDPPAKQDPEFDIVVFGATSFVGKILCRYLLEQQDSMGIKWAVAARSQQKLNALSRALSAENIPQIIADAQNPTSLKNMCEQTRVLVSTVGPYALFGEPAIKACVETGTDYCDLTGEVQWIKRMQDRYLDAAKASGAKIVHCCGFDSIPSDLGVHFLQNQAESRFKQNCHKIDMRVKAMKGGASGGTIASMINVSKEAAKDPDLRKELSNPYSICPSDHGFKRRQETVKTGYDKSQNSWYAPFVMAAINTRVVHRSNALSNQRYGADFSYSEAMLTGDGSKGKTRARSMYYAMGAFMFATAIAPSRWFLEKFILTKPGDGPSPEEQLKGRFDLRFMGLTHSGETINCKVTGDRDPGYGSTAKMLGQAAICLVQDSDPKTAGGFWTPATLLGDALIERLQKHSGLTFEVLDK